MTLGRQRNEWVHGDFQRIQRDAVAHTHAQILCQRGPQNDPEPGLLQSREPALHHEAVENGDALFRLRIDPLHKHAFGKPLVGNDARGFYLGRKIEDCRIGSQNCFDGLPLVRPLGLLRLDGAMGKNAQNVLAYFPIEAIHDGQHSDQDGDAQRQAADGQRGHERHQLAAPAHTYIAQRDEGREGVLRVRGNCGWTAGIIRHGTAPAVLALRPDWP